MTMTSDTGYTYITEWCIQFYLQFGKDQCNITCMVRGLIDKWIIKIGQWSESKTEIRMIKKMDQFNSLSNSNIRQLKHHNQP